MESGSIGREAELLEHVRAVDANFGQLITEQKQVFADTLQLFVGAVLFPSDPKRLLVCIDGGRFHSWSTTSYCNGRQAMPTTYSMHYHVCPTSQQRSQT